MILGYKKFKDCIPGQFVRLRNGTFMLISEYGHDGKDTFDSYLDSGERAHVSPDTWVAIIDLEALEDEIIYDLDYPNEAEK